MDDDLFRAPVCPLLSVRGGTISHPNSVARSEESDSTECDWAACEPAQHRREGSYPTERCCSKEAGRNPLRVAVSHRGAPARGDFGKCKRQETSRVLLKCAFTASPAARRQPRV